MNRSQKPSIVLAAVGVSAVTVLFGLLRNATSQPPNRNPSGDDFDAVLADLRREPYERPFGYQAPWNTPAASLPRDPNSSDLVAQLWKNRLWKGAAERHEHLTFKLSFTGYTYPVYDAKRAVGTFPVETRATSNMDGKVMPWNPRWKAASGSDAQAIVLDHATGREWNLFQMQFDGQQLRAHRCNLVQAGLTAGDGSRPGDFRIKNNGFRPSRGVGIQYLAMLVRPQEIARGKIEHALSMGIRNTSQTRYVPPATKLERRGNQAGIPEGTRFAIDASDQQIDDWIARMPASTPVSTKYSARVIAVALRDYGWFITDTAGRAHLQFEDYASAREQWEKLGLAPNPAHPSPNLSVPRLPENLLDGLLRPEIIYAIAPPPKGRRSEK